MVAMVIYDIESVWIAIPLGKPPPVSPEALHRESRHSEAYPIVKTKMSEN
jgi:hypothetical protein